MFCQVVEVMVSGRVVSVCVSVRVCWRRRRTEEIIASSRVKFIKVTDFVVQSVYFCSVICFYLFRGTEGTVLLNTRREEEGGEVSYDINRDSDLNSIT